MQQIRRSFKSVIAKVGLATAAMAAGGAAMAADISWSVGIGSPGYQVVVTHAPPVVMHQPVVVVRQPRMRAHRPVVTHVAPPRVIYTHAPVYTRAPVYTHAPVYAHGPGGYRGIGRDDRHGYRNQNQHRPRHHRHGVNPHTPGYDGNWGRN